VSDVNLRSRLEVADMMHEIVERTAGLTQELVVHTLRCPLVLRMALHWQGHITRVRLAAVCHRLDCCRCGDRDSRRGNRRIFW
jgi:hypothetical protein